MQYFEIDEEIKALTHDAEKQCAVIFAKIDEIAEVNSYKVLAAFAKNGVSESHFKGSTGYGYGDRGREVLDAVYADVFGTEDALVRHNFVSGTHALTVALFGVLRTGDEIISVTGKPYDTLEEVIGIRGENNGSLKDFGIKYSQLDLLPTGELNFNAIPQAVVGAKVVYLQRSRGYSLRPSISIANIEKLIKIIRKANPSAIVMVDNCYGEFVEDKEPTQVGADLIIGSLIKNPGGGIAQTGGYIAGKKDLIELCSYRLTSPGMGKEVGCTLNELKPMFMGLFFAPTVVASALKTAVLAAKLYAQMGYEVYPQFNEHRTDIIQAIKLGDEKKLIAFCQGIQKASPVDSFVIPEPWDMPGYDSQVIMAAGAFTMGASIELSADAPMREPYAVWMQGGLTYPAGKLAIMLSAQGMKNGKIIS